MRSPASTILPCCLAFLSTTFVVDSFVLDVRARLCTATQASAPLFSSADPAAAAGEGESGDDGDDEEPPKELVLDNIEGQMAQLRSKYPTSEADYLAAARARNAAKVQSTTRSASDEDWMKAKQAAAEKAGGAIKDDWDNSLKDAGNADSQILIPIELTEGEGGDGDGEGGDDPKLMLF